MNKFEYQNPKSEINSNDKNTKFKIVSNFALRISNFQLQAGQSLIELLIVIGISAIILPALFVGFIASREGKAQQNQRAQAITILSQTIEAVRSVREKGWSYIEAVPVGIPYHPEVSNPTWSLIADPEIVDGFTRQVVISDVYRSPIAGPIADSGDPGAVLDPSTKKIVATISWSLPYPSSIEETLYLTRFLDTLSYTETTETQFNAGIKTSVGVQGTSPPGVPDDGEVILGSGGYSNWCAPTLLTNVLDLPGQGYASAVTAIAGKAFAGTGENSSGLSFMQMNISDNHPPVPSLVSTFDGYKTNGVFGETNYGYISTDTNSKEVVIINISTSTFTESGYFNAPGNGSGKGIFVLGNVGYMTSGNKLYSFDLSSKTGSRPILDADGFTLAGTGTDIYVVGNYAYVAIEDGGVEMQIVNVSNPLNMVISGQADTNGEEAVSIFVNNDGTSAYLATESSVSQREMFIIDVSTKTGNRPTVGSYEANGMDPNGITVVPGNRAILVGSGGEEYQVIDISNAALPQRCAGVEVNDGIHDVASVVEGDTDVYSYIVTGEASSEFRIIEGGPGGGYATNGTFESQTFDANFQTANNRFMATFSEPLGTNIKFHVALANLVGGVCPATGNFTFVGPSGTEVDYFEQASGEAITFPFITYLNYSNPGQCFRYRAILSTTNSSTPVLNDVTINYSP